MIGVILLLVGLLFSGFLLISFQPEAPPKPVPKSKLYQLIESLEGWEEVSDLMDDCFYYKHPSGVSLYQTRAYISNELGTVKLPFSESKSLFNLVKARLDKEKSKKVLIKFAERLGSGSSLEEDKLGALPEPSRQEFCTFLEIETIDKIPAAR